MLAQESSDSFANITRSQQPSVAVIIGAMQFSTSKTLGLRVHLCVVFKNDHSLDSV